ncbi:MAG: hypothetical protein FJZ58_01205 [Chlamydiae bacterium]|nr:hypothetical protein [Chlamydiota bacterium]
MILLLASTLSFSAPSSPLMISQAIPGEDPLPIATKVRCSLQTSSPGGCSLFVSLDSPLPEHTYLRAQLASYPIVSLNTTLQLLAQDILTGTYELSIEFAAKIEAGIVLPQSRAMLLTFTDTR